MGKEKIFKLSVTEDERLWLHQLARKNNSSIAKLIIDLLEKKSKELKIPLPEKRSKRQNIYYPHQSNSNRGKYIERIMRESGLNV